MSNTDFGLYATMPPMKINGQFFPATLIEVGFPNYEAAHNAAMRLLYNDDSSIRYGVALTIGHNGKTVYTANNGKGH